MNITVEGFGQGPDNIAYQESVQSAYGAAASYGFSAGQCYVSFGPVQLVLLPSGFAEWGSGVTCSGEPRPLTATRALDRYYNGTDHVSTTWNAPANSTLEEVLGSLYTTPVAGTHPLYMCKVGKDTFTSLDVNCEGQQYMTRLGWIYDTAPAGVATRPIRRCRTTWGEHFDSLDMNCEGQIAEGILGYALS